MKFELYTQVMLTADVPEYALMKGDVGTVVEYMGLVNGVAGYAVEFFNAEGNTVCVEVLEETKLARIPENTIQQVRVFNPA